MKSRLKALAVAVVTSMGLSACNDSPVTDAETIVNPGQAAVVELAEDSNPQPNILFILTDDQTVNTINALGNTAIQTPNLDRLVTSGTAFSHVYNQGSWSGAVCAASRRMINTGRHLFHTGYGPKKAETQAVQHPLMGEVLQNNGYETFLTGKWHIDNDSIRRSFSLGSAVYEGGMSSHEKGGQFHPIVAEYNGDDSVSGKFETRVENKHSSELFTEAAINYLDHKAARNDKPFFMYVAYLAPHDPRESPQQYVDMYPPESIELPTNYMPEHPFDQGDHYIRDEVLLPFPRDQAQVKKFIAEYYAMITHLDHQIGRLLDTLEQRGYADNTVVIFTSDHGLAVGQHGLLGKQSQYDHSVRPPFIISGPGIPENQVLPGMFYLHSIFPTVMDLAGIAIPDSVETRSIMPLINTPQERLNSSIYGAYKGYQRMVRNEHYKLIYYPVLGKQQLFDVENDPFELRDLSTDPAHAERISSLHKELERWKQTVGDPLINQDPVASYARYFTRSKSHATPAQLLLSEKKM